MAYPDMHTLKCKRYQCFALDCRCVKWASSPSQWNSQGCLEVPTPCYCYSCHGALQVSDSIPNAEHNRTFFNRAEGIESGIELKALLEQRAESDNSESTQSAKFSSMTMKYRQANGTVVARTLPPELCSEQALERYSSDSMSTPEEDTLSYKRAAGNIIYRNLDGTFLSEQVLKRSISDSMSTPEEDVISYKRADGRVIYRKINAAFLSEQPLERYISDSMFTPEEDVISYKRADGLIVYRKLNPAFLSKQALTSHNETPLRICEYCSKRKIRCVFDGDEDECTNCMGLQQQCRELPPVSTPISKTPTMTYKRYDRSDHNRPLPPLILEAYPSQAPRITNEQERKTCQYCSTHHLQCSYFVGEEKCNFYQSCIASNQPSASISSPPKSNSKPKNDIVRLGCRNCCSKSRTCSRLHGKMSKCEACGIEGLEPDCIDMRKLCGNCSSRLLKCSGNEEDCDSCVRLGVDCVLVKKGKRDGRKGGLGLARDVFDVVDGVKANFAMEDCERCEKDEVAWCDRAIDGCSQCRAKGMVCRHKAPDVGSSSEKSPRFCISCRKPKFESTKGPLCDQCKIISINKSNLDSGAVVTCHTCRIMKTACNAEGETCIPCQKQNIRCIRTSSPPSGPPQQTHQRGLVSNLLHRAETTSKPARYAKDSEMSDPTTTTPADINSKPIDNAVQQSIRDKPNDVKRNSEEKADRANLPRRPRLQTWDQRQGNTPPDQGPSLAPEGYGIGGLPPPTSEGNKYPFSSYPTAPMQQPDQIGGKKISATQRCGKCCYLKITCDGGRPGCGACVEKGVACHYRDVSGTDRRRSTGCDTCRNLRATCDEGSPACTRCKERGAGCGYKGRKSVDVKTEDGQGTNIPSPSDLVHAEVENDKNLEDHQMDGSPIETTTGEESDDEIAIGEIPDKVLMDYSSEEEKEEEDWCLINSPDFIEEEEDSGKGRRFGF